MEIRDYLAKPDQTIGQHAYRLLEQLHHLKTYGYIEDEKLYSLVEKACLHHDDGKVNPEFQRRVKSQKKIRFNSDKEIPHNVLSGFLLNQEEFDTEEDYRKVLFAILYHHDYGNPYEMLRDKKEMIKTLLQDFDYHPIKRRVLIDVQDRARDDDALKIKGFLHKCDYSASGNYMAEYPNDFLESSLENVRNKWKKHDPDSDWNELQKFCISKRNENIIAIAQTGMGKTEAGLQWIGNQKGYFVLPLRTAINAIYERIRSDIILGEHVDTRLSVLHSESMEYYLKHSDGQDMDLMEYENRGKRFSMPLNISTMDQLFDFVFRYQGSELKLTTLSYSRVVIDEIQMYDADLLAYLIYGLKRITQMGGKTAIMTATLSPFIKALLQEEINFPEKNIRTFVNDMVRHHVKSLDRKINAKEIYNQYQKNENNKKSNKILVVCNTIKKAQEIYKDLKTMMGDCESLHILHSRFIREERAEKEKQIIDFGKTYDKDGNIDVQSGIWISTSLVEASLDIDFDYLFTELQDLNSLFQRLGRCNRKGVKDITEPNCYVYLEIDNSLLTGSGGFIDQRIFEVSKKAMTTINGYLGEKDKLELLNHHLTLENLRNSAYYNKFNDTLQWLEGIRPYEFSMNDHRLRNILSQDIIPSPVYEEKQNEIRRWEELLRDDKADVIKRMQAREEIKKYSVSIPYYQWLKYCNAKKSGKAEIYQPVFLGKYEELPVMECAYGELGFQPLDYDNIIREPDFI